MSNGNLLLFFLLAASITLFAIGIACMIARGHLIKMIMGLEFCGKGACLLFIAGGYAAGHTGVSQAVVITIIAIEAVVAGVALALAILLKKTYGTLDSAAIFRKAGGEES